MKADPALLRVSVASLDRVVFPHPQDGSLWLALERKATASTNDQNKIDVRGQPFGGGVHILDPAPLQELIGEIKFDSESSRAEGDFRILVPPSAWEAVKSYCRFHLANPEDPLLESNPQRELVEEFAGALDLDLKPEQYTHRPAGFVIEDTPVPAKNITVRGQPTVRLYRVFEVRILDDRLCRIMLARSQHYSDQELGLLALKDKQSGGLGHANSILTLPLHLVTDACLAIPTAKRYREFSIEGHPMDQSVLAILADVQVPQYQRVD